MEVNLEKEIANLSQALKKYRGSLIDLIEYKYTKFYKKKFVNSSTELKKIRIGIEKSAQIFKGTILWTIKDKINNLLNLKTNSSRRRLLEEIEGDVLDSKKFTKKDNKGEFKERFYDSGYQYDFYIDLKYIISTSLKEIFIVDPYLHEDIIEIYLSKVSSNIEIKILTNSHAPKGNFLKIAKMFEKKHKGKFEVRECENCHDRAIFVDNLGWVIGQSIKDSAKNKPTYMIKLSEPNKLMKIYRGLWNLAKKPKNF